MKNSYYKYILIVAAAINIILFALKYLFGITLYYDWCNDMLVVTLVAIILACPYKKYWVIQLFRIIGTIGMLFWIFNIYITNYNKDYEVLNSPTGMHSVVLVESSTRLWLHGYFTIDFYKQYLYILKKDTNEKLHLYDSSFFPDGIMDLGNELYDIGSGYLEWINDDVLHAYANREKLRGDEILEATINFSKTD